MSISPTAQRQLRSRIRRPHDSRYSAATCSPDLPRMSLACIAITSGYDNRRRRGRPLGGSLGCGKPDGSCVTVENLAKMTVPGGLIQRGTLGYGSRPGRPARNDPSAAREPKGAVGVWTEE